MSGASISPRKEVPLGGRCCATNGTSADLIAALQHREYHDPVSVRLPRGAAEVFGSPDHTKTTI
jgi:hypothetical protein